MAAVKGVRRDSGGDDDAEEEKVGRGLGRMILASQMSLVCG